MWGRCIYSSTTSTAGTNSSKSSSVISSSNSYKPSNESICNQATDGTSWRTSSYSQEYVQEAKRRGLTCGVKDDEAEKNRIVEEKARIEKERQEQLEREQRLKVEQEKIKKKAEEVARKKRLKEEKERKKKLAEEKSKRNAELKAKKLAEEKAKVLKLKIKSIKQKANNFYNDINDFVKSGGDLDLLKLSELYDLKPNPKTKWNKKEVNNYENLENYVRKNIEFNAFEENKIIERKRVFEQKKSEIILLLNNNLDKLNVLFRENFSIKEFSKPIKQDIKKIKDILNNESKNFVIETGMNVLNKSSKTIEVISKKINQLKIVDDNLNSYKVGLNEVLRNNFGTNKGKSASNFIKKIESVKTTLEKENLNNKIENFLRKIKLAEKLENKQKFANDNSTVTSKKLDNKISDIVFDEGYELAPPKQRAMSKLIAGIKSKITDNTTSARKKKYWIDASKDLCSNQSINIFQKKIDWIGYVDEVMADDDGSIRFEVDIDNHGNEVHTYNLNPKFVDYVLDLKPSKLFSTTKGDLIKFSGSFVKGKSSENECLKTSGFDSNPELQDEGFMFRFTDIKKIEN